MKISQTVAAGMLALVCLIAGCGRSGKPIIVGSKSTTESALLAEIAAQHIEHRLGRKVQRRLNLGGTPIAYQEQLSGGISLYAEYTGIIETEILKEPPSLNPGLAYERGRVELLRVAQSELLSPLGIDAKIVAVIRKNDPIHPDIASLGGAAGAATGWRIGVTMEFNQRPDGFPMLNSYHLPMRAPVKSTDVNTLYQSFASGEFDMIIANATDGALEGRDWKILYDDLHLFPPQQACYLVRQESLVAEPRLRAALAELTGKFTNESMRKFNAQVEVNRRPLEEVAGEFLGQAGLR